MAIVEHRDTADRWRLLFQHDLPSYGRIRVEHFLAGIYRRLTFHPHAANIPSMRGVPSPTASPSTHYTTTLGGDTPPNTILSATLMAALYTCFVFLIMMWKQKGFLREREREKINLKPASSLQYTKYIWANDAYVRVSPVRRRDDEMLA